MHIKKHSYIDPLIKQTVLGILRARSKVRSIKIDLMFYNKNQTEIDTHFVSLSFHTVTKRLKLKTLDSMIFVTYSPQD